MPTATPDLLNYNLKKTKQKKKKTISISANKTKQNRGNKLFKTRKGVLPHPPLKENRNNI